MTERDPIDDAALEIQEEFNALFRCHARDRDGSQTRASLTGLNVGSRPRQHCQRDRDLE
jgi:hypothetical protein